MEISYKWKVVVVAVFGTLMEMIDGGVKAMLIMGENPVLSDPNANKVKEELAHLDFLAIFTLWANEIKYSSYICNKLVAEESQMCWTST